MISAECGYQILETKICNGGRISHILTNISALNSKHFTYSLLNKRQPSAGQTMQLLDFKSVVKALF